MIEKITLTYLVLLAAVWLGGYAEIQLSNKDLGIRWWALGFICVPYLGYLLYYVWSN